MKKLILLLGLIAIIANAETPRWQHIQNKDGKILATIDNKDGSIDFKEDPKIVAKFLIEAIKQSQPPQQLPAQTSPVKSKK